MWARWVLAAWPYIACALQEKWFGLNKSTQCIVTDVGACNSPPDPDRVPMSHRFLRHAPPVIVESVTVVTILVVAVVAIELCRPTVVYRPPAEHYMKSTSICRNATPIYRSVGHFGNTMTTTGISSLLMHMYATANNQSQQYLTHQH